MNEELWITRDVDGWAFWSAKPRSTSRGEFRAGNGDQSENVKLLNELEEYAINCPISLGEMARVLRGKPVSIDDSGAFIVSVDPSTVEAAMSREDEIRERVSKATKGPLVTGNTGCVVWNQYYEKIVCSCRTKSDADFIAHAREDVPYLLSENDRLRREIEELRPKPKPAFKVFHDWCGDTNCQICNERFGAT